MKSLPKESLLLVVVFIVVSATSVAGAYVVGRVKGTANNKPLVLDISIKDLALDASIPKGNPSAPYTIVEFTDYECPPCRSQNSELSEIVLKNSTRVKLYHKDFPLSFHKNASYAAIASKYAAAKNKLWKMHDDLMSEPDLNKESILKIIGSSGLSRHDFEQSAKQSEKTALVNDISLGKKLKLPGTPSYVVINPKGEIVLARSVGQIKTIINL